MPTRTKAAIAAHTDAVFSALADANFASLLQNAQFSQLLQGSNLAQLMKQAQIQ